MVYARGCEVIKMKYYRWNARETAVLRSRTSWGVARAMAEQWGSLL